MKPGSVPTVAVIVPVMNEEQTIAPLAQQVLEATAAATTFTLVGIHFVDDGSTDGTWDAIVATSASDPRVRGIRLRRNFGKASALQFGVGETEADIIITMDGDLQDDPRELPRFVAALQQGADVISGWKKTRHDPLGKTMPSKLFNSITAWASGIPLHDFNCGFKAYRREVFDTVHLYGELHRFVPVLAHADGFRVDEIEVTHHPRRFGQSKYGARRFLRGLLDLFTVLTLTRYARKPGHLFGAGGLLLGAAGTGILGWLSILWLRGHPIGDRPLLLLGLLLVLVGVQMLMFGLLAELMISRDREPPSRALVVARTHAASEPDARGGRADG